MNILGRKFTWHEKPRWRQICLHQKTPCDTSACHLPSLDITVTHGVEAPGFEKCPVMLEHIWFKIRKSFSYEKSKKIAALEPARSSSMEVGWSKVIPKGRNCPPNRYKSDERWSPSTMVVDRCIACLIAFHYLVTVPFQKRMSFIRANPRGTHHTCKGLGLQMKICSVKGK